VAPPLWEVTLPAGLFFGVLSIAHTRGQAYERQRVCVGWVSLRREVPGSTLSSLMMEAVRASETSVDNYFTRQYNPEDNSELHVKHKIKMAKTMSNMSPLYKTCRKCKSSVEPWCIVTSFHTLRDRLSWVISGRLLCLSDFVSVCEELRRCGY
jgi:hypothetical protein